MVTVALMFLKTWKKDNCFGVATHLHRNSWEMLGGMDDWCYRLSCGIEIQVQQNRIVGVGVGGRVCGIKPSS